MPMENDYSFEKTCQSFLNTCQGHKFRTVLADPPWQFNNRTGKVAPEHKRLNRYSTMSLDDIKRIPVDSVTDSVCHLYLWVPNALLPEGLEVMKSWGFQYKSNLIWEKVRKDGYPDGRGVGFYFRNVTEILLFGVKGDSYRTLADNLSTVKNYVLDARPATLGLAANERITEIMYVFGTVKAGFAEVETAYINGTVNGGLSNGSSIVNVADVGGLYNGMWVQAVSRWNTSVYVKTSPLPKTGY